MSARRHGAERSAMRRAAFGVVAICLAFGTAGMCPTQPSGDPTPEDRTVPCGFPVHGDLGAARADGSFSPDIAAIAPSGDDRAIAVLRFETRDDTPRDDRCWWVEVRVTDPSTGDRVLVHDAQVQLATPRDARLTVTLPWSADALDGTERFVTSTLHDGLHVQTASAFMLFEQGDAALEALEAPETCDRWRVGGPSVQLGETDDQGAFVPYGPSAPAELLWGFQGSSMIVPRVRVDDLGPDVAECAHVRLRNVHHDGRDAGGDAGIFTLDRQPDGALLSGHFFDELDARAVGHTIDVEVTVTGDGWRVREAIPVPVVDDE